MNKNPEDVKDEKGDSVYSASQLRRLKENFVGVYEGNKRAPVAFRARSTIEILAASRKEVTPAMIAAANRLYADVMAMEPKLLSCLAMGDLRGGGGSNDKAAMSSARIHYVMTVIISQSSQAWAVLTQAVINEKSLIEIAGGQKRKVPYWSGQLIIALEMLVSAYSGFDRR